MKSIAILLFLLLTGFSNSQSWNQLTDFPGTPRDDGTSFRINTTVYCGSGLDDGFNVTGDFYAFDLITETWSPIASLPGSTKLQYATSFSYNGKGYVFGGLNELGVYQDILWQYDPLMNSWSTLTSLPAEGRSGASSFVIGDTVYIVGGKNTSSTALSEIWAYDLVNNLWTAKSGMPNQGMWRGIGYSWNGEGYIGLGKDSNNLLNTAFYKYNVVMDSWLLVPELTPTPRTYIGQGQIGDKIFLYGGMDSSGTFLNTLERINMPLLIIEPLNDLPSVPRRGGMAFTSDDDYYITTGVSSIGRLKETWVARSVLSLKDEVDSNDNGVQIYQSKNGLTLTGDTQNIERIELYQSDGKLVRSLIDLNNSSIEVNNLKNGIYYYSILGKEIHITGKIAIITR